MKRFKKDEIAELIAKLLWQPIGWHQGACLARGVPFSESTRRKLRSFKDDTRMELNAMVGNGRASAVL